jgi:hypothetical protein
LLGGCGDATEIRFDFFVQLAGGTGLKKVACEPETTEFFTFVF